MRPAPPADPLRDYLVAQYGMENETWAVEECARVLAKLNRVRRGKPRFKAEILGAQAPNAFTAPGKILYVSRRLLEKLEGDAALAMLLAHEIAHHDLGHLDPSKWTHRIPAWAPRSVLGPLLHAAEGRVHSRAQEFAADALALTLCHRAGYPADGCLRLHGTLKAFALDYGDLDSAYGPPPVELAEDPVEDAILRVRAGVERLLQTHPSISDREAMLRKLAAELRPEKSATAKKARQPKKRPAAKKAALPDKRATVQKTPRPKKRAAAPKRRSPKQRGSRTV